MTRVLYLQTRENRQWRNYVHANFEHPSQTLDYLQKRAAQLDAEWGRRRPWRIVTIFDDGSGEKIVWRNDAAVMFDEAQTKVAAKRERELNRTGELETYEDRIVDTAAYFSVTVKEGRMVGSVRVPTYLEALAARERLSCPDALVYAVATNGRFVLVTERLHRRLMNNPENEENERGTADQVEP